MPSARQTAFVAEYAVDLNATQAAIRAGYSSKTAKQQQGSRLLTQPEIRAAVSEVLAKRAAETGLKAEDIVAKLKCIAFSEPGATWKSPDVLKALELLGRYLKMFTDKVEVSRGLKLEDLVPKPKPRPPPATERGTRNEQEAI